MRYFGDTDRHCYGDCGAKYKTQMTSLLIYLLAYYRLHRLFEKSLKVLEFWKKFQALESP